MKILKRSAVFFFFFLLNFSTDFNKGIYADNQSKYLMHFSKKIELAISAAHKKFQPAHIL